MNYFIGNTDLDWYRFLNQRKPEDINFWQPSGLVRFKAVDTGSPFLLKLKRPINKVAGIGFFSSHSIIPISFAWEVFQERNGVKSLSEFYMKIKSYRDQSNPIEKNPNIGCIILTNPIFFDTEDWVTVPSDWSTNIVQGKTYNTGNEIGKNYWNRILLLLQKYQFSNIDYIVNEPTPLYEKYLTNVRVGQGAFRILVTDAYSRKCSITGEKTLPVLEAVHIKPYSEFGINSTNNGLLLGGD